MVLVTLDKAESIAFPGATGFDYDKEVNLFQVLKRLPQLGEGASGVIAMIPRERVVSIGIMESEVGNGDHKSV